MTWEIIKILMDMIDTLVRLVFDVACIYLLWQIMRGYEGPIK